MSKAITAKLRPESKPPATSSTRQRLVQAVIDIVRGDGLGALTTVEITRRAGIAQPGFYKHFPNVDACLEEATKQMLEGMGGTYKPLSNGASLPGRGDEADARGHARNLQRHAPAYTRSDGPRRSCGALRSRSRHRARGSAVQRAHHAVPSRHLTARKSDSRIGRTRDARLRGGPMGRAPPRRHACRAPQ